MPRRSGNTTLSIYKKRRVPRRVPRPPVESGKQVHQFVRNGATYILDVYDNNVQSHRAMLFQLSAVSNYTEFVALYDRYRIDKVEVHFRYDRTSSDASATGFTTPMPTITAVKDYDDATPLTLDSQYQQYNPVYIKRMGMTAGDDLVISMKPRVAAAGYGGTVWTNYINMAAPWCDTASANLEHYGIKWTIWFPGSIIVPPGTANGRLSYNVKYWLSFTDSQ